MLAAEQKRGIDMRIVLIGGSGFLGRHLVQALAEDGHACTVLTRAKAQRGTWKLKSGVSLVQADVYDTAALEKQFSGADAVVSMAGILNEAGFGGKGFGRVHVELVEGVIEACRAAGVHTAVDTCGHVAREHLLEIASRAMPQYGIELNDVMFRRVNYIESVRQRVYDRMISERKRIAAEKRSMGEGQKARILGTVDRELRVITSTANREAVEIKGKADAEATKIYADAFSQDPEFFSFMKTLESYDKVITEFDRLVGVDKIKAFHLNDSKHPLGSRKDRHEEIGLVLAGDRRPLSVIDVVVAITNQHRPHTFFRVDPRGQLP